MPPKKGPMKGAKAPKAPKAKPKVGPKAKAKAGAMKSMKSQTASDSSKSLFWGPSFFRPSGSNSGTKAATNRNSTNTMKKAKS